MTKLLIKPLKKEQKRYNVKPTERQKKAFKILTEKGCSKKEALREAGYSETVQNEPKKITETSGWQQLLNEYLPDKKLAEIHKQLLEAKEFRQMQFDIQISDAEIRNVIEDAGCRFIKSTIITVEYTTKKGEVKSFDKKLCFFTSPNFMARDKALDKAYKVTKKYEEDKLNEELKKAVATIYIPEKDAKH